MSPREYELSILDVTDKRWMQFVMSKLEATLFHHPSWSICLSESYGYGPFVLVMKSPDGRILAGLPVLEINSWLTGKRWVALPFSDHCSPLVQNEKDLEFFTNELINTCKALSVPKVEIRQCLPSVEGLLNGSSYFIHYLKLDKKPEELFKNFRKNHIRCIKKASKSGVVITQSVEVESLLTFYNLHLLTRKKHGVPIQPKKYFLKLWEHIIRKGMGFTMLAIYQDKAIAGGVFLHYNKNFIYKYGASDPEYIKLCGNHAFFWEAIQWGCKNGYQVMDWGKTEKSNEGLRKFKRGWGTEEKELCYSYIGKVPTGYSTGWKQKVLETTIRKSPVWVGGLLGKLLYKHVG